MPHANGLRDASRNSPTPADPRANSGVPDGDSLTGPGARAAAQSIRDEFMQLRARCQRNAGSIVTPMGDEMFYRYQESLIDEATTTLALLLQPSASPPAV